MRERCIHLCPTMFPDPDIDEGDVERHSVIGDGRSFLRSAANRTRQRQGENNPPGHYRAPLSHVPPAIMNHRQGP